MQTMKVILEDGTEEQRPFTLRRTPRQEISGPEPEPTRIPVTYPGEEAVPVVGGWRIIRVRRI